jgi:hypothetical protein
MPAGRAFQDRWAMVALGQSRHRVMKQGRRMLDERLPQFLHRPVQILWFDAQEFIVVLTTIFVSVIVGGPIGWSLFGILLLFIPWKRTKPRGFIVHLAWRWGLLRFRHYPGPTQTRFFE